MKKTYQIEAQRAVQRFERMAANGDPAVQMVLLMAEIIGWLRKGVIRRSRKELPYTHAYRVFVRFNGAAIRRSRKASHGSAGYLFTGAAFPLTPKNIAQQIAGHRVENLV